MTDSTQKVALNISGAKIDPDGTPRNHLATIHQPMECTATHGWICNVVCLSLFPEQKSIAGANAAQALRLARLFVFDLMDRQGVTIDPADRDH